MDKIIDCKSIANKIKADVKKRAEGNQYKLIVLTNPSDDASKAYVKNKKKACVECGIEFEEIPLYKDSNMDDLHRALMEENCPIIVQLPISDDLTDEAVELLNEMVNNQPLRDCDGFTPFSFVEPATPKGVMKILEEIGCDLEGKHVVVCGRSDIVGKPVAKMCLDKNATVTITHSKTKNLKDITSQADVLIVAVGKSKLITEDFVKDGAIIIDVGINRDENNRLCGDVDMESVLPKVAAITPVPRGVGLTTVACLVENVVELYEMKV